MNRLALALVVIAVVTLPIDGFAQNQSIRRQIRNNQARLDSIRGEREELESQLQRLSAQVRTITSELDIIEQQKSITGRLVNELDRQVYEMNSQVDTITIELLLAQDAYAEKRAILQARLVEIYKRGSLFAFEALLAANSFGELVSRYKYLFLASRQDQALVAEIEDLRDRIGGQRAQLVNVRGVLTNRHDERSRELSRFQTLERQRQIRLRNVRGAETSTGTRIDSLAADENRMVQILAALDRARRAAGAADLADASITSDDLGSLAWPVDGNEIVFDFGDAQGPDQTTITHQGIGIGVPVGTEVRAVADGEAAIVGPFGTYGLTVVIEHGGGMYSNYHYLSMINIQKGQFVAGGSVIGQSGRSVDHGPLLEFQIRQTTPAGNPIALDPVNWLRRRRE
jgi:septal ring factor EnvC (AmiA/AmiB activator)